MIRDVDSFPISPTREIQKHRRHMGVKSLGVERCRTGKKEAMPATKKQGYRIVKAFSADTSHETLQHLPSNPHC
jgi:hypothetical protein